MGTGESLGLALEIHLTIFVELIPVDRHAGIEDGIELIANGTVQVQLRQFINLRLAIHLVAIESGLQIVELVGIHFLGEDGGAVVIRPVLARTEERDAEARLPWLE